ncbi:MAG: putative hydrolase YxeP [Saprospiraceae bacterium]|jgi:amidohydrolase|nr:putative hydrolase YxeP [Saprospiraceae bacterium]
MAMESIVERIRQKASDISEQLVAWRRFLHQNPELSFEEAATSAYIQGLLSDCGIPHRAGFARHGIVGLLSGEGSSTRVIALRADMDALPIQEENDCPYVSRNAGVMHACGHDVHMTWLLGALVILQDLRGQWSGRVKFLFQPGEERLPGGASAMISEGALEDPVPDCIIGQHVQPDMPVGVVGLRDGMFMASSDELYLTIHGQGGHAAMPHLCIDPVVVAAELVLALQKLVAREKDPFGAAVLTIGRMTTPGGATNVIPSTVHLEGTFRCMDEEYRKSVHQRIRELATGICNAHGAKLEMRIESGYPALYNEPALVQRCRELGMQYFGDEGVTEAPARMTSEDFAWYGRKVPAVFCRTGIGKKVSVHHPRFDVDETCLAVGAGWLALLAMRI